MIKKENIKLILFDVDNTLVYGDSAVKFYGQYSVYLEKTLAKSLQINSYEAKIIADSFRRQFNGHGEKSFDALNIGIDVWYQEIFNIDPKKYLRPMHTTNKLLESLKKEGFILGAITDGPTEQSKRILRAAKIKYENLDFLIGWEMGKEMPKNGSKKIYQKVCREYGLRPSQVLMIGDSMDTDVLPAMSVGLKTIYVRSDKRPMKNIISIKNVEELI